MPLSDGKYVDDLTLEKIVCKDSTNKFQLHVDLDKLDSRCNDNDMLPKAVKCHVMHINFLKNQPGFPKSILDGEEINTADNMKLLGVTIQNNLSWDIQTNYMITRASKRTYVLYVLKRFRASAADLTVVYLMYIRPVLEYASPLWHSSITKHQIDHIELIQKRACCIILGSQYKSYAEVLKTLELYSLVERREQLLSGFGDKLLKSVRPTTMLPAPKKNRHDWALRSAHQLYPPKCRHTRFRKSIIPAVVDRLNNQFFIV